MIARCFLSGMAVMVFTACGGAQSNEMADLEEPMGTPAVAASGNSPGKTSGQSAEPDETAEKAKQFCEREVAKSAQTPVEMLDKKQISACLIAVRPEIQTECAKGVKREIVLKIIVGNDGSVVGAFPVGDGADSAEATCAAERVKPIKFPAFTGKEQMTIEKFPFEVGP
ncbi:MAG: hypothetical protein JXX29_09230 [Deltaproteobacteria bacterium]|nr:hypothetical protein [Deltaproteobacteria bacterium]MBN2671845.1 hypothetical protein [Deltaproteobacteria bacterium]